MSKFVARRDIETGGGTAMSMSRTRLVQQLDSQNEVLSLMVKAYILSLVLVVLVLVCCVTGDAWVPYAEFCYHAGTLVMGRKNYTNF